MKEPNAEDQDLHEIYHLCMHNLHVVRCDVNAVIRIVQLVQQDVASRHGNLEEDDAVREVREECLETLYMSLSHMTPLDSGF